MKINPEMRGNLPHVAPAQLWQGKSGDRKGWKLTIPGHRPLATPALSNGRIFLGGGFGSYDFYAFDALTGALLWQYQTEDDGPTAAVVYEDYVAFNTESCELEVLTVEGQRVWKHWLGDPLMSMPAIGKGRVFQVYPNSRGDHKHYLAAFDLATGKQLWTQPLSGEIITAPVLSNSHVYLTNLDGTMSCFHQKDGEKIWQEEKKATSSPAVWDGECFFSQRHEMLTPKAGAFGSQQMEGVSRRGRGAGAATMSYGETIAEADWLDHEKRQMGSPLYAACELADANVGFAYHKGDAKMEQAHMNLGHGHISSLWAYQGSKPFLYRGRLFSAIGDTLHCLDPHSEEVYWQKRLYERDGTKEILDNVLTPPALVNGKLFVATIEGDICCLSADSGEELWRETVGDVVVFQPAIVQGRVYVGTSNGNLFCLETGDEHDDGWYMWGANGGHNGTHESEAELEAEAVS